jgi:hypothetical protein
LDFDRFQMLGQIARAAIQMAALRNFERDTADGSRLLTKFARSVFNYGFPFPAATSSYTPFEQLLKPIFGVAVNTELSGLTDALPTRGRRPRRPRRSQQLQSQAR